VRTVLKLRVELDTEHGTVQRVARQLGYGVKWCARPTSTAGIAPGASTAESKRINDLDQEIREFKRANEILKRAASSFGAEFDRQPRRSRVHRR
jgi:transposase